MTAHGAYTKAMTAMRHVQGYAHDASKNLKAMWAAGPIREDPAFVDRLNKLAERFRALEDELHALKQESYELSAAYLAKHQDAVTKEYEITGSSPSMRVRS